MFRQGLETSDGQVKLIQERITSVESNFVKLCSVYGAYCRKLALLRDKGDDISKNLKEYATEETLNRSLRNGLMHFSDCLAAVEDYRQAKIDRLEVKVIGQLTPYENICKMAKDNVKNTLKACTRQEERKRQLQKARARAPLNRQEISLAESELTKASVDVSQTVRQLEDLMDSFEQKKLQDIKRILLDYANVELLFHAKAVEIYTKAYNHIKAVNEEEDLREFRDCLKLSPPGTSHLDLVRSLTENSPTHKLGNASTTRGSSMQSLVGQLQALRDEKNEEPTESEEDDNGEETGDDSDETESQSSISTIEEPDTQLKLGKKK